MRSSPGFFGRVPERDRLRRLLHDGQPGTVIRGPYGIGKTRLVQEVLAERTDLRVGWVAATAGGAPTRLDVRVRSRPGANVLEMQGAVFDLLVVDEVEQLDERGASVLSALAERTGVRVIGIRCDHLPRQRPIDDALADLVELRLDPLATEDVAALAQATLGAPLGTHALADLAHRCGGHPLFVEELVADARGRGILCQDEDGVFRLRGDLEVPAQLASELRGRLGGLTREAGEVLDLVAIAGRIPLRALVAIATPAVCRDLERRGLVTVDHTGATISCVHPVLADAVLGGQAPAIRDRRHEQLVALLRERRGVDPVDLALWNRAAGTAADPELLLAGARVAAARLDFALAVDLASTAVTVGGADDGAALLESLSCLDLAPVEVDAWVHAARTYGSCFSEMTAGRLREAEAPLERTIEALHGEPYPKARLLELQLEFVRHHVQASRGALDDARRHAEEARSQALAGHDRVAAGMFAANVGHVARFQGDLRTADRALADADHELAALDPLRLRAQLSGHRAIVAAELGRRTEVAALLGRVDTGPGPAPVPRAVLQHRVSGWLAALDRDADGVQRHFHAAVRTATEGQQPLLAVFAAHSAVRLGYAAAFVDELVAATAGVEGDLAPSLVAHARAVVAGDPVALEAAAQRFAVLGARLWAAEAFVVAAEAHGAGDVAGSRRCRALAGFVRPVGAEGAWILGTEADDPGLGIREREVADLAAEGCSNREIAERLGVSTRTVDTQLRSVFRKLGVTRRRQLPASPLRSSG